MPPDTPVLCPRDTCRAELVMLGPPGSARGWSTSFECFTCGFQGRLTAAELKQRTGIDVLPRVAPPKPTPPPPMRH